MTGVLMSYIWSRVCAKELARTLNMVVPHI